MISDLECKYFCNNSLVSTVKFMSKQNNLYLVRLLVFTNLVSKACCVVSFRFKLNGIKINTIQEKLRIEV